MNKKALAITVAVIAFSLSFTSLAYADVNKHSFFDFKSFFQMVGKAIQKIPFFINKLTMRNSCEIAGGKCRVMCLEDEYENVSLSPTCSRALGARKPLKCCFKKQPEGYLQVATTKKQYFVGEQVKLTDPPFSSKNFFSLLRYIIPHHTSKPKNEIKKKNLRLKEIQKKRDYETTVFLPEVSVSAGPDIITYVNQTTKFVGKAKALDDDIVKIEWDFDGDGIWDWSSVREAIATHIYKRPGIYYAKIRAFNIKGIFDTDITKVTVKKGRGKQQFIPEIKIKPKKLPVRKGDGIINRYAIMINGGKEQRFWDDVVFTYETLINNFSFTPENIYLLNYNGKNPEGNNPFNMIDFPATKESLDQVFNELSAKIDKDDLLFVWITDHGGGYCGPENRYYGFSYVTPEVGGDEKDYLEKDFKLRSLYVGGYWGGNVGLNTWKVFWRGSYYYRVKFVSHFDNLTLENGSTISDNDIFIEKIIDYLLGDYNRNGRIEEGEVFDFDGDGILPYDEFTGHFDEGDWGNPDIVEEYFRCPYTNPHAIDCICDINLDNIVDIDINYSDLDHLVSDGKDIDNQGLFDGVDINGDGDMDDWVSIDEFVKLLATPQSSHRLYDDELAAYLDSIDPGVTIIFLQPCFSGGFIEDLSKPSRIIMSATTEEDFSRGNIFVRGFTAALRGEDFSSIPLNADSDDNGKVSMVEAFNYAAEHDGFEIPQYDDNGDKISHTFPIPSGGDGYLGIKTYLLPILPKSLLNNTGDVPIKGYLVMKVKKRKEKCVSEKECLRYGGICLTNQRSRCPAGCLCALWQDEATIVNDLITNHLRTIPPKSYLALDAIWIRHGGWQANNEGTFKVYAALVDSEGNVIETKQGKLEDSYEFKVLSRLA